MIAWILPVLLLGDISQGGLVPEASAASGGKTPASTAQPIDDPNDDEFSDEEEGYIDEDFSEDEESDQGS